MKPFEPYRIFFPLGWLYAICGTILWVAFQLPRVFGLSYPGVLHASWMAGGFFLSFVAGFLLTAVPKFTGSHLRASATEVGSLLILLAAPLVSILPDTLVYGSHAASFALLIVFFVRRYRARRYNLPDFFLLIPVGLLMGVLGSVLLVRGWIVQGRLLAFQAPMLCLMLGVGGKMIPAFLGWESGPVRLTRQSTVWGQRLLVALTVVSFVLEAVTQREWARSLRAVSVLGMGFGVWRLHRIPLNRTRMTLILRISLWSLVLGVCLHAWVPALGVHGLHLLFIGGAGSMILGVGTRVSLAHGAHGLALEKTSRVLRLTAVLLPFAAVTRVMAPWFGNYERHLAYASLIWITVWVAWGGIVLPKIFTLKREP